MVQEVGAKAITGNSANLTMTKEYLVVKGKHFQVRNGYLNCSNQTQAVAVKDILSMEYLTMCSKRLFILFMVLMTFVVFGGVGIQKTLSVTRQIDKEVQKIENVYNQMSDEDIDIDITGSVKSAFSQLGIKGIIIVYALLVVGSVGCFVLYWLVSAVLTNLCTYDGVLPQGAVTSPYIANLICYHLDARLNGFCSRRDVVFTRYADDLSFSSNVRAQLNGIENFIKYIIKDEGFEINEKKTRYLSNDVKKTITGITINNEEMHVDKAFKRRIRAMINNSIAQKDYSQNDKIRGMVAYVNSIEADYKDKICKYINALTKRPVFYANKDIVEAFNKNKLYKEIQDMVYDTDMEEALEALSIFGMG